MILLLLLFSCCFSFSFSSLFRLDFSFVRGSRVYCISLNDVYENESRGKSHLKVKSNDELSETDGVL